MIGDPHSTLHGFGCRCPGCSPSDDDVDTSPCPGCGKWVPDHDGFGILAHVAPMADPCGYCSHPSRDGGVCGICGDLERPAFRVFRLAVPSPIAGVEGAVTIEGTFDVQNGWLMGAIRYTDPVPPVVTAQQRAEHVRTLGREFRKVWEAERAQELKSFEQARANWRAAFAEGIGERIDGGDDETK